MKIRHCDVADGSFCRNPRLCCNGAQKVHIQLGILRGTVCPPVGGLEDKQKMKMVHLADAWQMDLPCFHKCKKLNTEHFSFEFACLD